MRNAAAIFILLLLFAPALRAGDWPMLAHDPQRTGWATAEDEVKFPTRRKWYRSFHEEGLACGLQPVIVDGLVYVGTMHGTMHAIDAETGKDVWTGRVGSGILHSAAVVDGKCFFGSLDGKVYALAARTGEKCWTYQTGKGLWNAPVVAGGAVYIGGRDRFFYALSAANGELVWRTPVGGPFLCSPAYDEGRIYAAAEDIVAYCLDARDGKILWKTSLQGVTARAYHPVITGDLVMFRTMPGLGKHGPGDLFISILKKLGFQIPTWRDTKEQRQKKQEHDLPLLRDPEVQRKQIELVREEMSRRPGYRSFFVFDKRTGEEPFIAPVIWKESCGGTGTPPIVTPDGRIIVKYAGYTWARYRTYSQFLQVGYLNPKSGFIKPIYDPDDRRAAEFAIVHDEMCQFTGAGSSLYHARNGRPGAPGPGVESWDLVKEGVSFLGYNVHWGIDDLGPTNLLRVIKGQPLPFGLEFLTRGAGVFGGTGTYAAVSIADGTIYWVPGHEGRAQSMLIAIQHAEKHEEPRWRPTDKNMPLYDYRSPENLRLIRSQPLDWDMLLSGYGRCWPDKEKAIQPEDEDVAQRHADEAREYARQIKDEELLKYIWEVSIPARRVASGKNEKEAELTAELKRQVQEVLSAPLWVPLPYPNQMNHGWIYFDEPSEIFQALAHAYPFVGEKTQQEIRDYLSRTFQDNNPLTTERLNPGVGERREYYDLSEDARLRTWPLRPIGLERLYPLWAWAYATGRSDALREAWPRIRPWLRSRPRNPNANKADFSNGRLSGLIAYVRLAHQFGDEEAEKEAVEITLDALRERIIREKQWPLTKFHLNYWNTGRPSRYLCITPEIGRLLHDHAFREHQALFARYITHHRPTWFLAWGPLTYHADETCMDHPINPWATFIGRAFVFGDNGNALRKWLDIPWCKADLYFIEKLAATMRACAGFKWVDLRK